MDKIILKEYFSKYWKYAVIFIMALLLLLQCNKNEELIISSKNYKTEANKFIKFARNAKNNLELITTVYNAKIDSFKNVEKQYKEKLEYNSKNVKAKLGDLKHYSTTDNTNYFKDRYNDTANVIQVEKGTTLKDTISKKVITDLVIGDGARAEVKILRDVFKTKDNKFELCSNTVDSLKFGIKTISKNYEDANIEKDKALSNTEKALKRENRKKNVWKGIAGAIAIGAGYLLFVK